MPPCRNVRKAQARSPERRRRQIKLNDEQRQYVVRRLAAGDGPARIARDMQTRFGVKMSRQGIAHYDPTREPDCPQDWAQEFVAARRALAVAQSNKTVKFARTERLVLQAIETLTDRILKGVDAEGRKMFAKRPEDISDNDRIARAAGLRPQAEGRPIRRATRRSGAFSDAHDPPAAGRAAPSASHPPGRRPMPAERNEPRGIRCSARRPRRASSSRRSSSSSPRCGRPSRATSRKAKPIDPRPTCCSMAARRAAARPTC